MNSARDTDRFFIDLLDIDALPRKIRPAFLEWARALDEYSGFVLSRASNSDSETEQAEFGSRVRLEAARRHALRACQVQGIESDSRVRDVMVYLSWNPDAGRPDRREDRVVDLPATTADDAPDRPARDGSPRREPRQDR